jgi:PIN domain nuclease of toxin-antitoxin system
MKLLLDTHIWIWSRLEPQKISRKVAKALITPLNELWLSPISVWELTILASKSRIVLKSPVHKWITEAIKGAPLREAAISHDIALEASSVLLRHPDPADRFLVATARVFDLTLVTADERLIESGGCKILSNR